MEQDTRVWVYILIWNVNCLHKIIVSQPALAIGLGGIILRIIEKILIKWRKYVEFGCIFWHNCAFKISHHFLYKHNYIVSVEGSSIVLYIDWL